MVTWKTEHCHGNVRDFWLHEVYMTLIENLNFEDKKTKTPTYGANVVENIQQAIVYLSILKAPAKYASENIVCLCHLHIFANII